MTCLLVDYVPTIRWPIKWLIISHIAWHGLSVSLLGTQVSCAKTAEPTKIPFGVLTLVGPRNHVLNGVKIGSINSQPVVKSRQCSLLPNYFWHLLLWLLLWLLLRMLLLVHSQYAVQQFDTANLMLSIYQQHSTCSNILNSEENHSSHFNHSTSGDIDSVQLTRTFFNHVISLVNRESAVGSGIWAWQA